MADYVCEKCSEPINETASRCPSCGYHAGKPHRKWWIVHGILATILFFSVIGIPFGLYSLLKARKHRKLVKSASPAVKV